MLRRTTTSMVAKIPAALCTAVPVYEVINAARGTSAFDSTTAKTTGAAIAALHAKHVHLLGDWVDLSPAAKDAIRADEVTAAAARALDTVLDKSSKINHGEQRPKILICFGSQTKTAETLARQTGLMASAHGFTPTVVSMNESVQLLLNNNENTAKFTAVLFLCSTYGQGEFPTTAQKFYDALAAPGSPLAAALANLPTAVFGLGNSGNPGSFNGAAKALSKLLPAKNSIAKPVYSCELQGHDAAYRAFASNVWAALAQRGLGGTLEGGKLVIPDAYEVADIYGIPAEKWKRFDWMDAHVTYNERVSKGDEAHVFMHAIVEVPVRDQIQILGRRLKPTDQLVVHPSNTDENVARALAIFGLTGKEVIECAPKPGAAPSFFDGQKITTRTLFRDVIDLQGVPQRSVLALLANAAGTEADAKALEYMANDLTTSSEYGKLTARGNVFTVLDVLQRFPSVKLTLAQAVTRLPHIQPRFYSNAHDPATSPEKFHVVYHVPVKDGGKHEGLATGHLRRFVPASHNQRLWCTLEPGKTTLPAVGSNALLIGLGSGIGLVKAAIDERAAAKKAGQKVGQTTVIHGFRKTGQDQLFKRELEAYQAEGLIRYVPVASYDVDGKFASPFDRVDAATADWIKADPTSEVLYCGVGGSVPALLASHFARLGVDVNAMGNRYHQEYFTADLDQENLIKRQPAGATAGAGTLAERIGCVDMMCFQCEQTAQGVGCTKVGVCGKTPAVAALQDLVVHQSKILGFWLNAARQAGAPENAELNRFTLFAMFTTLTNVNFDSARFVTVLGRLHKAVADAKAAYVAAAKAKGVSATDLKALPRDIIDVPAAFVADEAQLIAAGRSVGVLQRFMDAGSQNSAAVCELLVYGVKGICAYADHALVNNFESTDAYEFLHRALGFLVTPERHDLNAALGLALEAGKVNVGVMTMLQKSHKTLGAMVPRAVPVKPVAGKCILVSGHDLIVLKGLLERCEKEGIKVYTHGEMLPAHGYPALAKFKSLAGHFGTAWYRQAAEFAHFPGPILMTTNCITEPHASYKDRIYTAGAVGWTGVKHCGDTLDAMKWDDLLAAAKAAPGFTPSQTAFTYPDPVGQSRPESLTVGFGTEAVLGAAGTIIDAIGKGDITRFYVVGGCDGYEGTRGYFESLAKEIEATKTGVVLTVGCGKYRFNHLDLGTIGQTGIPRLLDLGQCNDAQSAVNIALALSDATKIPVADLPISIALSWLEQKAAAVLLSLLHLGLKPIRLGPSLPAFITKDVLAVLVEKFGVLPCGDAAEDIKSMTSAKGMIEKK